MTTHVSTDEMEKLYGEDAFLFKLYVYCIKKYMDTDTKIAGVKRKLSWRGLMGEMYINPRSGVKGTGNPAMSRLRRAIARLEELGIITNLGNGEQLIFKCNLAYQDSSVQKQAGIPQTCEAGITKSSKKPIKNKPYDGNNDVQAGIPKNTQAGIYLMSNISNKLDIYIGHFNSFWESYPRKQNKQAAVKAWAKHKCDNHIADILADIEQRKQADANWRDKTQYVPHASTYINAKRWQDEDKAPQGARKEVSNGNGRVEREKSRERTRNWLRDEYKRSHDLLH